MRLKSTFGKIISGINTNKIYDYGNEFQKSNERVNETGLDAR